MELKVLGDGTTVLTVGTRPGLDGRKQVARLVLSAQFAAGYKVERELGAGAMGAVYAGVQLATGRPVAVKFLLAIGEPEAAARFQREARLLARVSNPAVLRVIDVGELSGHPFLVTDLLPGGSLRSRLTREVRLTVPAAIATAARVLEGLEACHAAGVVHRDLKPDNVMYDAQAQAVVVDLGIARLVDDVASLTRTGAMVGTPRYMAPEAWSGDLVGPPADVFAVGVMLYEMLAGRHPFEAASTPAELLRLLEGGAPPLAEVARVPPGLAALVHRALAWNPADRPASAAAMRAELTSAPLLRSGSTRRPVSSRAVPVPAPPRRMPRVALGALFAVLLAGGFALTRREKPVGESGPASAPPSPSATASPAGQRVIRGVLAVAPTCDRACVSDAAGLHLVTLGDGPAVDITPRPPRRIARAVFGPDGAQLALIDGYAAPAGQTTRTIVDAATGRIRSQWNAPTMNAFLVRLGLTALFECSYELIAVRDLATGHAAWQVELSPSATHALSVDDTFTRFCRSSPSLWDVVSRDAVKTQAALLAAIDTAPKGTHVPRGELTAIPHAFTPDSNWVFIDERKTKEIRMVPSRGHKVRLAIAHESASWLEVTAVSTDGAWLAGGYEDGTLAVWRTKTGKLLARFRDPDKPAQLAVDQLSRRLVSVNAAGVARVYELEGR